MAALFLTCPVDYRGKRLFPVVNYSGICPVETKRQRFDLPLQLA